MSRSKLAQLAPISISALSKTYINLVCGGITSQGLPTLLDALKEEKGKARERGVLTISNHISVVDDPFLWQVLPWKYFFNPRTTRWVSGAQDIMFTNPVFSKFFDAGQVISTDRFGGIFQEAITESSRKLGRGDWVHVFPEGKVSQPSLNPYFEDGMFRFRWGVSRIFLSSPIPPKVIPMHIAGFDKVMPEPRGFPAFVPRPAPTGTLRVAVGEVLDDLCLPLWKEWRHRVDQGLIKDDGDGPEERERRIQFANLLRAEVEKLGVSSGLAESIEERKARSVS
ncbi:Phosphate acyltransferase [Phaffia rhodozyma]|uniref:Tafazzin family protein n=1 Tax=Phaffia rhodozyma TaxID=264483 RepID=A0A0F7SV58_PHARH|nr:Phosphate acyltransferase [Phaffia rhodozyma]